MLRQIRTPVSVLLAGVFIILLALAGPDIHPLAAPSQQNGAPTSAAPYITPGTPYPGTATTIGTVGIGTPTVLQTVSGTTATPLTPVTPVNPINNTPTETPFVAAPTLSAALTPSFTPTITPTPTPDTERVCIPGQPVTINGEGPANAGILLYFDTRAVGGGSVGMNGRFALTLVVGNELPGRYPVRVQIRGTQQVLRVLDCVVPSRTTPTVTP